MEDVQALGGRWARWAAETAGDAGAGELLRLSARRFLDDLRRPDLEFRAAAVERCLLFLGALRHYKGGATGRPFRPEPWQEFIIANVTGFYWRESGVRRFTRAYIEIARKNGKSFLVNALAMYFLLMDGEASPEVIVGANSREQAKAVDFEMCSVFARQLDPKGRRLKVFRDEIRRPGTMGRLKVISADTKTNDGYNPSVGIIDEYHASPTSRLRDVIVSGMGMRRQPLLFVITTAGFDKEYPCYRLRTACAEVLHGVKRDDSTFAAIFSLDEADDWRDPGVWRKANPCLGVTVSEKYLREQVASAQNNPSEEVGVRTKNLNQWTDAASVWIPEARVLSAMERRDRAGLAGRPCFVGVDLSAISDFTAVSYMFPGGEAEPCYFFTDYYLPEASLRDRYNKALYADWARRGLLTLTPGNVTDYDYITRDILRVAERCDLMCVSYDPYNATQWAIQVTGEGLPMEPFGQNLGNFNRPTKEFERLLLSGRLRMEASEITAFCLRNVALKVDHNGNCKPDKGCGRKKIDGVIAMLQALGASLQDRYACLE